MATKNPNELARLARREAATAQIVKHAEADAATAATIETVIAERDALLREREDYRAAVTNLTAERAALADKLTQAHGELAIARAELERLQNQPTILTGEAP